MVSQHYLRVISNNIIVVLCKLYEYKVRDIGVNG